MNANYMSTQQIAEQLRYAEPETKTIPLGPEDVPPGSVFHPAYWTGAPWIIASKVCINDLIVDGKTYTWSMLLTWKINRSIPLTGKWNPNSWEPCHKLANPPQPTYPPALR